MIFDKELTPGKVLDDTVGIELDPNVEGDEDEAGDPAQEMAKETRSGGEGQPRQRKAYICREIVHQDQIYQLAIQQPSVEFNWRRL